MALLVSSALLCLLSLIVPSLGQNATNVTYVTHITHVVVHQQHQPPQASPPWLNNSTNVTLPMPFDSVSDLPPLATTPPSPIEALPPLATTPPPPSPLEAGIPLYKHPHFDAEGKPIWFPRIVGGTPATIGEFPSKVSLQLVTNGAHFCGGTLLTMQHVLTAAHCVTDRRGVPMSVSMIQAMADDLNILPKMGAPTRQVRQARTISVHDKYSPATLANDLALVRVTSDFVKTATLYPTKRATAAPAAGQLCSLAGWGVTAADSTKVSPTLQRVNLEVVSFEHCNAAYQGTLAKGMMCAVAPGRDACQGDSGGALICQNRVAGIVSFGAGCAHPNFPGVYMDVVHHEKWISKALNGAQGLKVQLGVWIVMVAVLVKTAFSG
ncbi:hypothetical protein pipiens_003134 [Culex pipiens pipiens]|uniref:Peptidase S1 domain-containing protein n=1 Tax=Culex pipiens pipiens TaxID=38569 RepID=A0ABD1D5U4_CULPP